MDNFTNHTLLSYSNVEDMMSTAGSHDYFSCMDIWIVRKDRKKKKTWPFCTTEHSSIIGPPCLETSQWSVLSISNWEVRQYHFVADEMASRLETKAAGVFNTKCVKVSL